MNIYFGIRIIFIQGNKIKMGIFTKFKLTEVLITFWYLVEIISINKLQNLKIIKYFANLINYYNFKITKNCDKNVTIFVYIFILK